MNTNEELKLAQDVCEALLAFNNADPNDWWFDPNISGLIHSSIGIRKQKLDKSLEAWKNFRDKKVIHNA